MPNPEPKKARLERLLGRMWTVLVGGLAGIGIIGWIDWVIKARFSFSSFYLLPICFVSWFLGIGAGLTAAVLAALVWLAVELYGRSPQYEWSAAVWQGGSRLVFFVVVSVLVSRIRGFKLHLEALVRERTAALEAEVVRRKELEREAAEIADREQERVAHELHDRLAAYLSGIAFRVKSLSENLDRRAAAEAVDARELVGMVNEATDQVRNLARLLVPIEGSQIDLELALSRLSAEVERVFGVTCPLEIPDRLPKLSNDQVQQLYRIAHEAVRNAIHHSQADLVRISVRRADDKLQLVVDCEGQAWGMPSENNAGLGLRIMRHRSERLGGKLSIQHTDDDRTLVICEVPLGIPSKGGQESPIDSLRCGV